MLKFIIGQFWHLRRRGYFQSAAWILKTKKRKTKFDAPKIGIRLVVSTF